MRGFSLVRALLLTLLLVAAVGISAGLQLRGAFQAADARRDFAAAAQVVAAARAAAVGAEGCVQVYADADEQGRVSALRTRMLSDADCGFAPARTFGEMPRPIPAHEPGATALRLRPQTSLYLSGALTFLPDGRHAADRPLCLGVALGPAAEPADGERIAFLDVDPGGAFSFGEMRSAAATCEGAR